MTNQGLFGTATGTAGVRSFQTLVGDSSPKLSINNVVRLEGNGASTNAVFTVTLSNASAQTVTVDYFTSNGTAVTPSDYQSRSGTLTFSPGQTTRTIAVPVNGDTLPEANETFFVNLGEATNATITDNQGQGTITNDDVAPTISINNVSVTEGTESDTLATFTISLSAASQQTVRVDFATANGTAVAPGDYSPKSNTLSFAAGTTSRTVSVQVQGDRNEEPNETFALNLSNAFNATIADAQGVATIVNDDGPPTLSINNISMVEGNAATANATFTVTLSAATVSTVTVNFTTSDVTATAPADYTATNGTLTFAPGERTKNITVPVKGDVLDEFSERFEVRLTNPTGATLTRAVGICFISDNDAAPTVSISDVSVAEGDDSLQYVEFTITLSAASGKRVVVDFSTEDGTATAGSDYEARADSAAIAAGTTSRIVQIIVNGDAQAEPDETFTVNLTAAQNATIADGEAVGTIANDD